MSSLLLIPLGLLVWMVCIGPDPVLLQSRRDGTDVAKTTEPVASGLGLDLLEAEPVRGEENRAA